jgi:hypothetical protein
MTATYPTGWNAAMDAFDTAQFQNGSKLEIVAIPIGSDTANPDSGSDQYLILNRKDGEALTPKQAKEWLLPRRPARTRWATRAPCWPHKPAYVTQRRRPEKLSRSNREACNAHQ